MDLNVHRRRLRGAVDDDEPSARERDLEQTRSRDRRVVLTMLSPEHSSPFLCIFTFIAILRCNNDLNISKLDKDTLEEPKSNEHLHH
jgi:hypothetical protein